MFDGTFCAHGLNNCNYGNEIKIFNSDLGHIGYEKNATQNHKTSKNAQNYLFYLFYYFVSTIS